MVKFSVHLNRRVFVMVPYFQRQPFRFSFYFTAAGVKCGMVAVNRLPVLHQSADYIYFFDLWLAHKQKATREAIQRVTTMTEYKQDLMYSYGTIKPYK